MGWLQDAGSYALGGVPGLIANQAGIGSWLGNAATAVGLGGASQSTLNKQANLNSVGANAQQFAGSNQAGFNGLGSQGNQSLAQLQAIANGQNSVSAMQLQQAQQAAMAQQRSLAAGASPANSAMAARNAANNLNTANYGLAGQQAVAGLAERNQAQTQYANLLGTLRGQDLQGALGSNQTAVGAYSGGLNGVADPTIAQQWAPIVSGIATIASK